MRYFVALVALFFASALGTPGNLNKRASGCKRDACSAAVASTKNPPSASRREDCSSFLRATVYPPVSTSTVYVRSTIYTTIYTTTSTTTKKAGARALDDREAAPAAAASTTAQPFTNYPVFVPAYASNACSSAAYSSACSCAGVKSTTITTTTPTVTVTSTRGSTTATVTAGARPACGSTVAGVAGPQCTYKVTCDRRVVGGVQTRNMTGFVSEYQCLRLCEDYTTCLYADYERATGLCEIWYGTAGTVQVAEGWDFLQYVGQGAKCQPPQ